MNEKIKIPSIIGMTNRALDKHNDNIRTQQKADIVKLIEKLIKKTEEDNTWEDCLKGEFIHITEKEWDKFKQELKSKIEEMK